MWVVTPAWSQSNESFRVEDWRGGSVESGLRLAMYRAGPGINAVGGVLNGRLRGGPGVLFSAPAQLADAGAGVLLAGRAGITNATIPGLQHALLSQEDVRSATDEFLADYAFSGTPDYTTIAGLAAGQPRQLVSVAAAHELLEGFTIAAGFHRPVSLAADFRAAGIEFVLDAGRRSGSQTIDIDVLGQLSGASGLRLDLDVLATGFGYRFASDDLGSWDFGASVSRTTASTVIDWSVEPELMIVLSGSQQYFFNDPSDPNLSADETNDLYWRAQADYRGSAWSARSGLRFASEGGVLTLMVDGRWTQDIRLADPSATVRGYLPSFLNLAGSPDPGPFEEELMDVERLDLAKPNLTRQTSDSLGTSATYRRPDEVMVTLDLGLGPHTLSANYVHYMGELSMEGTYGSRRGEPKVFRVGKSLDYEVRAALDLRFPDRMKGLGWALLPVRLLFLDFDGLIMQAFAGTTEYREPHYRIGGGVVYGSPIVSGVERNVRSDLNRLLDGAMPSGFALARSYTVFENLDVGVTAVGVPDLLLRTSLTWRLGRREP
ncbi:MAG: hypothetical protein JJ896_12245 [Rhodothermales bacterium]|nr:hypothetical protein [Rhodothermales bacterium]